jgi:putative phosphoesterase
MKLDTEFLRQHYAAMPDEELESIDPNELVAAAREIYDAEVASRQAPPERPSMPQRSSEVQPEIEIEEDWLEDASEAYSRYVSRGNEPAPEAEHARQVLEAAGIPCHLELFEEPDQEEHMQFRWRVLVPGKLSHRAAGVLDRDIFNEEFEASWRSHLEVLSDEDLRVMDPGYAFCGLYDRLERANKAYDEELARRGIVSDIHGNLTAFEAVLTDLRETAPDLILHGGDLGDSGSHPAEVVDRIRDLGWPGVLGNTDEMLFDPDTLTQFAAGLPQLKSMFDAIEEMAADARQIMGEERLAWLRELPRMYIGEQFALVHASPGTAWRAPLDSASDSDLESTYGSLVRPLVVYGHIHRPYVRKAGDVVIANSGSVGMPHDGDRRASYLLLDHLTPSTRRVAYDVDRELKALRGSGRPHADWIARTLEAATPEMP